VNVPIEQIAWWLSLCPERDQVGVARVFSVLAQDLRGLLVIRVEPTLAIL